MDLRFDEKDFLGCCGSTRFAKEMALTSPFSSLQDAISAATDIWFNKVDVNGWLQAFAAHPQIGGNRASAPTTQTSAQWSNGEQLTALATATKSSLQITYPLASLLETDGNSPVLCYSIAKPSAECESNGGKICIWMKQSELLGLCVFERTSSPKTSQIMPTSELYEWNARYREKFGFIFIICASGRSTDEILAELKRRYPNRPFAEFEIAAQEQMKITELRLAKLFSAAADASSTTDKHLTVVAKKAEDRINIIGGHVNAASEVSTGQPIQSQPTQSHTRSRPPITTHVLDVSRGSPASGIDVLLEKWVNTKTRPTFGETDSGGWVFQGSSTTDSDGRSGQLMKIVDDIDPGIYRISFNTGKYNPNGFFPYVSIVFEIRQSQTRQHFHVPLLLSPFSFSTYRGS